MKYLPFFAFLLLSVPLLAFAQQIPEGFVSLTNIEAIRYVGNQRNLTAFLNSLYRICIGVAAILAVLQIMRAGIMYMGGDSITEKKEAKKLIGMSIAGLVLVLSPTIVFGIINPDILSLKIGRLSELGTGAAPATQPTSGGGAPTTNTQALWTDSDSPRSEARQRCTAAGGTPVFTCQVPGSGQGRVVPNTEDCKPGEDGVTVCNSTSAIPTTGASCSAQYTDIQVIPSDKVCNTTNGFSTLPLTCCSGAAAGAVCCGKPK